MTGVARERADKRIDTALGQLQKAALEIGKDNGIPEGISGHSIAELLGRMAYVPSMARELRRACGQELAKIELNKMFDEAQPDAAASKLSPISAKIIPGTMPLPDGVTAGTDLGTLDGISVQTVKALHDAGLVNVGDVVNIPDEHLVKMQGLGEKSVAHLRAAIAKGPAG